MVETRSIGLSGLVVVAVAVLLSTTLLPALLAILGRAIDTPRWLARRLAWYHAPTIWERWARSLSRHPYRALTLGGLGIALLTAPVFLLKIGLPSRHWWPSATEAGRGAETLSAMGASGIMLPIRVLVEVPEGETITTATRLRGLRNLTDSLAADPRVGRVTSLMTVRKGASLLEYSVLYSDLPAARADLGDFLDAYLGTDQRIALVDVFPADTTSLTTSMDLVRDIRAHRAGADPRAQGHHDHRRRLHRGGHRFPGRPAARLPAADRRGARRDGPHAGHRVPLGAGADQGHRDEQPVGERDVRAERAGVPVWLGGGAPRAGRTDLGDLRGGAGHGVRHRVRPEHGLRGVPAEPDQGGVRPHGAEQRGHDGGAVGHGLGHHLRRARS